MIEKSSKNGVIITTILSAVLYCLLIVFTSLSPLSDTGGEHANEFGTAGIWSAIGMILAFYLVPLLLYIINVKGMTIVMAILCSMGILTHIVVIASVLLMSLGTSPFPYLIEIIATCILSFMVNFMWFFIAFRTPKEAAEVPFDSQIER
ncbi:DUF5391 domain-containing protein [Priestia endophytica]|uniref:DUF5391 domain-containing protein n=1 Tax=Priestia endophytica TaxID=135735 RepID=UPI00227E93AE|nr:DUF5391 domain-containing protein [Priestia endophytica]MCY8234722.1 DUF5391 domain-containing protein [Priestia endophytica]